jgi:invasion protein IalB
MAPARRPLAALLLSLLTLPAAAAAEGPAPAWETRCSAETCTLSRSYADAVTNRRLATLSLSVAGTADPVLAVAVPLGAALRPGLRLSLRGLTLDLPFDVCFPDGCRASAPLEAPALAALLEAERAELALFAFGKEDPVGIDAVLTGLPEALNKAKGQLSPD